jgi:phosphate transport system protein
MTHPKIPLLAERIDRDMEVLRRRLRLMADLVSQSLEDAVRAMATRDRSLAYHVVLQDNRVDVLERHIDRLCQEFLIRHMPVAAQLRFVMAVAKVNSEIERIGDYAEAIARRAVTLADYPEFPEKEPIVEMSKIAFQMLRNALQAFLEGDVDLAMRTVELDRQVDAMNANIFKVLAHSSGGDEDLTSKFALLGLLNRIERVADRAENIAEEAVYVVRGQVLRHLPRHDMRVLFLGEHNACSSQMAEAIARSTAPAQFIFQSAGSAPTQLDPRAVECMARHDIDISRLRPKALGDVGTVEDFHVVVTLSKLAEAAWPKLPYRAIHLNWDISDPSAATGDPAAIAAAYETAYDDLRIKITELVEGLLGVNSEEEEEP